MHKVWIFVAIAVIPFVASLSVNKDEKDIMYYIQQVPQGEIEARLPAASYRIYTGQLQFAVSLLKSSSKSSPEKSHIISPHSVYRALLIAYFGAAGKTRASLERGLFLNWAQGNRSVVANEFDAEWKARAQRVWGHHIQFNTVEELYVANGTQLNPSLTTFIAEALQKVDFSDAEKRREEINKIVEEITENHIKDLLPEGSITPATNLFLANAAYFKGRWATQFNPKLTTKKTFNGITPAEVDMMSVTDRFKYGVSTPLEANYVILPYLKTLNDYDRISDISMLVFLPVENTATAVDEVLDKLSADDIGKAMKNGISREVHVQFPKISLDGSYVLGKILEDVGIKDLLGPRSDLSIFSNTTNLYFDDIVHKAKIEIDEEGSVAAAATATMSRSLAFIEKPEPTKFHCDHPFVFTIYDQITTELLFTGVYRGPN